MKGLSRIGLFRPFSQDLVTPISRAKALKNIYAEAKKLGVEIRTGEEANAYLDLKARMNGVSPEKFHGAALGPDLILVRESHLQDVRVLREELIHTQQQVAGFEISPVSGTTTEIQARQEMIARAHEWGITHEEVTEMRNDINVIVNRGGY